MLGFVKASQPKVQAAAIAAALPGTIDAAPQIGRAAVLLLANCLLDVAARLHDKALLDDPRRAAPAAVAEALGELAEARERIHAALTAAARSNAPLPGHDTVTFTLLATDLALVTVAFAREPVLARPLGQAWKSAWSARSRLPAAVILLREYEMETGIEAAPRRRDGAIPSDVDLIRLGNRVPGLFRRRTG